MIVRIRNMMIMMAIIKAIIIVVCHQRATKMMSPSTAENWNDDAPSTTNDNNSDNLRDIQTNNDTNGDDMKKNAKSNDDNVHVD
jgi:hypothetical protein